MLSGSVISDIEGWIDEMEAKYAEVLNVMRDTNLCRPD